MSLVGDSWLGSSRPGVGQRAPSFRARDQEGRWVTLAELHEGANLVLYFYPKDFTRVCTTQACLFRDRAEVWKGTRIVGVSADPPDVHREFIAEHGLPFTLLSDEDRTLAKAYGIVRFFGAFPRRITYVIDRSGIIRGAFQHELSAQKHVEDVERTLAGLDAE